MEGAAVKDDDPGEVGWDPTFQGLGYCDKNLDLNPMQGMLWKDLPRKVRFLSEKPTGDSDGSRNQGVAESLPPSMSASLLCR